MYNSKQSANKRLAVGTLTYMIGNLMSKMLQILILPIITAALNTEEYGYYDLLVTTISLVTPIVTFSMIEGMFRYMFDGTEESKKKTVSTVIVFLIFGSFALGLALAGIYFTTSYIQFPIWLYLNYISYILFNLLQKLARCQNKNKHFAISGVLNTGVMLALQALSLLVLKMHVDGMLMANCLSYCIASIYLAIHVDVKKWFSIKDANVASFKELFSYSAPLIPNSICWWLVASSDRYIITFFLGTAFTGIYSIAGKFSQLLTFLTSVFQLAWQESAIIEKDSRERDRFYTQTFNQYMKLLMGGYLIALPLIKILIPILLTDSFQVGYLYNPILLIGAIFSAFSQFYGSAYMVFKKTKGVLFTTVIAAIVNLLIGILLVKHIGLFAPALGTAISFFIQWLLRIYDLRDCFKVSIEIKSLIVLLVLMGLVTFIYYKMDLYVQLFTLMTALVAFLFFNKNMISIFIKKALKR